MSAEPAPLCHLPDPTTAVGLEWAVDASGLDPRKLAGAPGREALAALFHELVAELDLHPVAEPIWHVFPGPHHGVTGILALSESHLACHTFPESGGVTLNLYTCRERPAPDWNRLVTAHLGTPDGVVSDGSPVARVRSRVLERTLPGSGPDGGQR